MKDYEDEAFDDIERAQQRKVATGVTDGSGWRKRQIAEQGEPVQDDYKAWYEEAMAASNEAGYVGLSAAETIRELDKIVSTQPAAPVQPAKQEQGEIVANAVTVAGLHASIGILSHLVDVQRQLLVEVEDVCGRDGHGGPLEDGESDLIDRVRAQIAAIAAPTPQPKQEQGEPVAKVVEVAMLGVNSPAGKQVQMCVDLPVGTKLYTTPQQRKPLTIEQIRKHWQVAKVLDMTDAEIDFADYVLITRDVEALHGIKE